MRLSVIIPVHNARRFLREAVESVLAEGIRDSEIILIDDGSTDGSLEAVAGVQGLVRLSQTNRGGASARNAGLSVAQGELIAFLDADDVLASGGLKWRVDYLEANPDQLGVAGSVAGMIDSDGRALGSYAEVFGARVETPPPVLDASYLPQRTFPAAFWLFLFRREVIDTVGILDETTDVADDLEYMYRVLSRFPVPFFDVPTVYYRAHDRNLSIAFENGRVVQNRRNLAQTHLIDLNHRLGRVDRNFKAVIRALARRQSRRYVTL